MKKRKKEKIEEEKRVDGIKKEEVDLLIEKIRKLGGRKKMDEEKMEGKGEE